MRPPTINRELARELDRRASEEFGLPSIVLMENAGRGVADKLCQFGIDGRVVVCCGPGNNGGDGFVIARHLDLRGIPVEVLAWGWGSQSIAARPKQAGDAAIQFEVVRKSGIPLQLRDVASDMVAKLQGASWVVDALLGTGSQGEPRPPLGDVIEAINSAGAPVVAIDLPSGLDCDSGRAAKSTVRALHTCTFVAAKPGFYASHAEQYTGRVHVLDIGAPRKLVEEMLRRSQART